MLRKKLFYAVVLLLLFQSCHFDELGFDEIQIAPINPTLGFKIGETTYTVRELVKDLENESITISEGEDFDLKIVYEESIAFSDNESLIQIETIRNTSQYFIPTDVPAMGIGQTVPFSTIFEFQFNSVDDETIDSIFFKGGTLEYSMHSSFPASVDYDWVIVNTREINTNLDLNQSNILSYDGSPVQDTYNRSLDGLKTLMFRVDDQNRFNVELNGDFIVPAGQGLTTSQSLDFNLAYVDPKFSTIYGYFGNQVMDIESVDLDLTSFSDFLGNGVHFSNPSLTLEIANGYGIDILLDFANVTAFYADGSSQSLIESLTPSEKLARAPDAIGQTRSSSIGLNADNSNFADLISAIPNRMVFSIGAEANPAISTLVSNFLQDTSRIDVTAKMEIPFQFRMDGFETEFEFDTPDIKEQEINSLSIQMTVTNEIPFDGNIFLDFLDENGVRFAGLDESFHIASPTVGSDGRSVEPLAELTKIVMDTEDIQNLINSSTIQMRLNVSTFESDQNKDVVLYADYQLKMELALIGDVNINL